MEKLSNPDFKPLEFERFRNEAGSNYFVLSPQRWIESTQAIGIISKSGRYGGTQSARRSLFVHGTHKESLIYLEFALDTTKKWNLKHNLGENKKTI